MKLEILGFVDLSDPAFGDIADDAEARGDDVAGLKDGGLRRTRHFTFSYSALASRNRGMSGSAYFHRVKNSR